MPELRPVVKTDLHPIARRPCPRCGWDMSVTSMIPGRRNRGERIFECQMCEQFEGAFGKKPAQPRW
jgi:hypothetical protein